VESIRYWLNNQLRKVGQYILRNELAATKQYVGKMQNNALVRARVNQKLIDDHSKMIVRVGHVKAWLEHRHVPDNSHRFMFDYITQGHEPTSGKLSATQGVHPTARWGIRDFDPTGESYSAGACESYGAGYSEG
jgi:hypothetical protein